MILVCDDRDERRWKEERRKRITASDLATFLDLAPSFFTKSKEDLLREKLEGEETELGNPWALVHGSHDEANNLAKASKLFGLPIVPYHWLISHVRWPYLGATLDGLGILDFLVPPDLRYARDGSPNGRFDTMPQVMETIHGLRALSGICLVEMKQTESHLYKNKSEARAWIEEFPAYHLVQVQCQLWLSDLSYCLVAAQLGASNMTGYLVERDPGWAAILDDANARASQFLGPFREEI